MKWEGREQSSNVEDRRGMSMAAGGLAVGGGLGTIVLILIMTFLGANPAQLMEQVGEQKPKSSTQTKIDPAQDRDAPLKEFVSVVMRDTEDVWGKLFREQLGARYQEPKLVLFTGEVRSACGSATASVGPFYCPGDSNVYLDFEFFRVLKDKLGAPGDFAMAYVVAHEIGHHVQNQLGLSAKVQNMQNKADKVESNRLSVRTELQADYKPPKKSCKWEISRKPSTLQAKSEMTSCKNKQPVAFVLMDSPTGRPRSVKGGLR